MEIGIYFCVSTDILTFKFKKKKKKKKSFFSEAIRGMKLKLCINVHDISLYINCFFFLMSLPMCFRCYGNSNFPYTCSYNGKKGNWHLFLCYCRYFDKSFTEMFLEKSSINRMNFVQITDFD